MIVPANELVEVIERCRVYSVESHGMRLLDDLLEDVPRKNPLQLGKRIVRCKTLQSVCTAPLAVANGRFVHWYRLVLYFLWHNFQILVFETNKKVANIIENDAIVNAK